MPATDGPRRRARGQETTLPPAKVLRFETLADLYAGVPQLAEQMRERPGMAEEPESFLYRLRHSHTPEEAITFTAFAFVPKLSVWWGYECLRAIPEVLNDLDREMMEHVARWIGTPTLENRHATMKEALWAPEKRPGVHLALAVGWSGGSIAPMDPAPVPVWRCPRSINTAVLSSLAEANISRRAIYLTRFMDMAQSLFKVY